MSDRRQFLAALLASSLAPLPSWADLGNPAFLTAARHRSGEYRLCGLDAAGGLLFTNPLPDRGHAAAAHPTQPIAIAFARRPGRFAVVIDCAQGRAMAELTAPEGRHFYGHGTYSSDGSLFFTTENDLETLEGRIGVWDAVNYARVGEFPSAGIGPHDLRLLPGADVLVVANGGIETHPESGRAKLNLPVMQSNLAYLQLDGTVLDVHAVPDEMQLNSLRHLAVRRDGLIGCALQWQGDPSAAPALLALHRRGEALQFLIPEPRFHTRFQGYAGSIAFSGDGETVAITSPRGGVMAVFSAATGARVAEVESADICGVAPLVDGLAFTTGQGAFAPHPSAPLIQHADLQFDNHLIAL